MRLGVLRNPESTGNRGRPAPPLPEGCVGAETAGPADCPDALARLAAAGAEAVVIDGGDGTVRTALTHLEAAFGHAVPIAILAHGNTNLVARKLGAVRPAGLRRLAALAPAEAAARARAAPVMRLAFGDGRAPLAGFIAGWGAYAAGTRIAAREIAARHRLQVLGGVLATLRRSLSGPEAARLRRGVALALAADGAPLPPGRRFLGIATVLEGRLVPPLEPFWGGGRGGLRYLDIAAPPRRLALAAPFVATGRPLRWMRAAGYRSARAHSLTLTPEEDAELVLDGDPVPLRGCTTVTLSARDRVTVLRA
jgi:hypothetical protein